MTTRVLLYVSVILLFGGDAIGANPGLFAEDSASFGGVTVRRMRDTSEHVICYVASGAQVVKYREDGRHVSISCLKVNP